MTIKVDDSITACDHSILASFPVRFFSLPAHLKWLEAATLESGYKFRYSQGLSAYDSLIGNREYIDDLKSISENPPASLSYKDLIMYAEANPKHYKALFLLILACDSETLKNELSDEILISLLKERPDGVNLKRAYEILSFRGHSEHIVSEALEIDDLVQSLGFEPEEATISNFDLLNLHSAGHIIPLPNLPALLQKWYAGSTAKFDSRIDNMHIRLTRPASSFRANDYLSGSSYWDRFFSDANALHDLESSTADDTKAIRGRQVLLDAPLGICLVKDQIPLHVLSGFAVSTDTFLLFQSQGIIETDYWKERGSIKDQWRWQSKKTKSCRELTPFAVPALPLDLAINYAQIFKFKRLLLVKPEANKNVCRYQTHLKQAKKLHQIARNQFGFDPDPDGHSVLKLSNN